MVGPNPISPVSLEVKEVRTQAPGRTVWGHSRKAALCKPRREHSAEIKSADTLLILDFIPPKL